MRQETTDRSFSKAYNLRVLTSRTYLLHRIQSSSPDNAYGTPNCRCRRQCLSCHHNPGAAREKKRASQRLILVVTMIYFVRVSFILVCLACSDHSLLPPPPEPQPVSFSDAVAAPYSPAPPQPSL